MVFISSSYCGVTEAEEAAEVRAQLCPTAWTPRKKATLFVSHLQRAVHGHSFFLHVTHTKWTDREVIFAAESLTAPLSEIVVMHTEWN